MPGVHDLNREPAWLDDAAADAALEAALRALAPVAAANPTFRADLSHPGLPGVRLALGGGPDGPWIEVVPTDPPGAAVPSAGPAAVPSAVPSAGPARAPGAALDLISESGPELTSEPEPGPMPDRGSEPEPGPMPDRGSEPEPYPMPEPLPRRVPLAARAAGPEAVPDAPLPPSQVRLVPMGPVEPLPAEQDHSAGDAPAGGLRSVPAVAAPEPLFALAAEPASQVAAAPAVDEERDLVARLAEVLGGDDWHGSSGPGSVR